MIEQQYYTRERGGLFINTDGYDSIAKSPKLKLDFIKKNLHPLCSYDLPFELQKSGEIDESKYPPQFMILPIQTGELIIGQAVYKSKDFTGLRSTFFMHNYVLSANERRRYIKEPEKLFGINQFASSYDVSKGSELPTLAAIPYEGNLPLFKDREGLFKVLKLDEMLFMKLLYAVFKTVGTKKKIFIILDVPIESLGDYAKALLYHLYMYLPWSIAEELGVCTYAKTAEAKKNIQITFLEKGDLRYDAKMEKEFVFDFVNSKFLNVEFNPDSEPYFEIASKYALARPLWERFNNYVDQLLGAMKDKAEKSLTFYNFGAVLFEMSLFNASNKVYDLSNSKLRDKLLAHLLSSIYLPVADEFKRELMELMNYALANMEKKVHQGYLFEQEEISVLLSFRLEVLKDRQNEEEALRLLLLILQIALKQEEWTYIKETLTKVSQYERVYLFLFAELYEREALRQGIAYRLIEEQFKEVSRLDHLINKMKGLEPIERVLMSDIYYEELILDRFKVCMKNAIDKIRLLVTVQKWCKQHENNLYSRLTDACEAHFLETIDLERIPSERELSDIHFKRGYENEKFEAIMIYQNLRTSLEAMSPQHIKLNKNVQSLIKHFYKQSVKKEDFYMLVYAFLEEVEADHGKASLTLRLNLEKVLTYLHQISDGIMIDFIIWSKGQEIYINKNTFDRSIIYFFTKLKAKEGKWPKEEAREKLAAHPKTKLLYVKLIKEMQPAFVRILTEHKRGILISSIVLLVSTGVGIGGYIAYEQKTLETEKSNISQKVLSETMLFPINYIGLDKEEIEKNIEAIMENKEKTTSDETKATNDETKAINDGAKVASNQTEAPSNQEEKMSNQVSGAGEKGTNQKESSGASINPKESPTTSTN